MTVDRIEIELADARSPDLINLVTALDDFLNKVCGVERNHGSPIDRLAHDDTQMFIARIAGQAVGCAGLQVFADGTGEVNWNRQQAPDARCGSGLDRQAVGSAAGNHGISSRCPEALSGEGVRSVPSVWPLRFQPDQFVLREMADEMMVEGDVPTRNR
jgi:hypothetical protein